MNTKTRLRNLALYAVILVTVVGFVLLGVSLIQSGKISLVPSNELGSAIDMTQMTISLPNKGSYFLNNTSGRFYFNSYSKLRIFDSKENLVFSIPIGSLPQLFSVDSGGYYSIILENVTFDSGTRLAIIDSAQSYSYSFPNMFLRPYGQVLFVTGMVCLVLLLSSGLVGIVRNKRIRFDTYRDMIEIAFLTRLLYGALSLLFIPMVLISIFLPVFSIRLDFYQTILVTVIVDIPLSIYWIKLESIASLFLSLFGYKELLRLGRVTRNLVFVVIPITTLYFVVLFLAPSYIMSFVLYLLWILLPLLTIFVLCFPLVDPLTADGEARICLVEFLAQYCRDRRKADFLFVKNASDCLATILEDRGISLSPACIEDKIVDDLSSSATSGYVDKRDSLIQLLLLALNPLNPKQIYHLVGQNGNTGGKSSRWKTSTVLDILNFVAVIAAIVVTILNYYLRL